MEKVNSVTSTIATEQLPFHTLGKARRVYMRRMKHSFGVLAGSLTVVATIFTIAALSLSTVIKVVCTLFLVAAIYVVCARIRRCRVAVRSTKGTLINLWQKMFSINKSQDTFFRLVTLAGVCATLFAVSLPNLGHTPFEDSSYSSDGEIVSPIGVSNSDNSVMIQPLEEAATDESKGSERILARSILGTWTSVDKRYLVEFEYGDAGDLLLRYKDNETEIVKPVEIETEAELREGKSFIISDDETKSIAEVYFINLDEDPSVMVKDGSAIIPLRKVNGSYPRYGWELIGSVSTGESLYVDNSSISQSGTAINFTYQIGNETILGEADCSANKWYASGYGEYSPQSQDTQNMLDYVCSF